MAVPFAFIVAVWEIDRAIAGPLKCLHRQSEIGVRLAWNMSHYPLWSYQVAIPLFSIRALLNDKRHLLDDAILRSTKLL